MRTIPVVVITGAFRFPDGDAAAARVLGLGKALRQTGVEVVFCGWEAESRPQDLTASGCYEFEGFKYFSQADLRVGKVSAMRRLFGYILAGRRTLAWLKGLDKKNCPVAVIAYHGRTIFLLRLIHYCRARKIRLLFDCTEWYDSRALVGGRFGLVSLDETIRMRFVNRLVSRGIVISRFLEDYYLKRRCVVARVPPTVDFSNLKWNVAAPASMASKSISLVYAGVPGKKDLLANVIRAIFVIKGEGQDVVLNLVGPRPQEVESLFDDWPSVLGDLGDSLIFHGRVPQGSVPELVSKADFSVLLRPPERFAQAGFPTKVVESLAAGVPVICNLTSDLGMYVREGKEGLIASDHSVDSFVSCLRRATGMSLEQRLAMREFSRVAAQEYFSCQRYADVLKEMILG